MMRRLLPVLGVMLLILPAKSEAGLYAPAEPTPFSVDAEGNLKELIYVPVFKSMLDDRFNGLNPAGVMTLDGRTTFRGDYRKRLADLPATDPLGRSAAQLRLGMFDDAINLLQPQSRSRNPSYALLMNLAHAHTGRGEFDEAIRTHAAALFDTEPPAELPGYTTATTPRIVRLEREIYVKRLRQRRNEASRRTDVETQQTPDLFGTTESPMAWSNAEGKYEPGVLQPLERAKLPKDAVAVVQQLLLWSPEDTPLLWLLAELYTAEGRFREAEQVFDQLTWGRNFTNRKTLMEHRTAVREAAAKMPAENDDQLLPDTATPPPPGDDDAAKWQELREELVPVIVVFAGLTLLGFALFGRSLFRRRRRRNRELESKSMRS